MASNTHPRTVTKGRQCLCSFGLTITIDIPFLSYSSFAPPLQHATRAHDVVHLKQQPAEPGLEWTYRVVVYALIKPFWVI
jgi:hypothetical protein